MPIFAGDIRKANGLTEGSEDAAEVILFTMDAGTVSEIESLLASQRQHQQPEQGLIQQLDFGYSGAPPAPPHQPLFGFTPSAGELVDGRPEVPAGLISDTPAERPFTAAGARPGMPAGGAAAAAAPINQGYETPNQPRGMVKTICMD